MSFADVELAGGGVNFSSARSTEMWFDGGLRLHSDLVQLASGRF